MEYGLLLVGTKVLFSRKVLRSMEQASVIRNQQRKNGRTQIPGADNHII